MAVPVVQTLDQVMAELAPTYQAEQDIVGQQQAAVTAQGAAQRAGLEAQKVQGFNGINNQATGRGMSFSGIPLDEQATYLSTKYLPGVQASIADENAQKLTLAQQLAQIRTRQRETAMGRVDNQTQALNQWNLQQEQLAASAREGAANRAASAASRASEQPTVRDMYTDRFMQAAGKDTKVSPETYKLLRKEFVAKGYGSADDFKKAFAGDWINQSHWQDYR